MLREISDFTSRLDAEFLSIGYQPLEGLTLLLVPEIQETGAITFSLKTWLQHSKKSDDWSAVHEKLASLKKAGWMIDTFKCMDAPYKAIHSCSPFCLAFKRTALEGGESYQKIANDIGQGKNKQQLYDRIDRYFEKATDVLKEELTLHQPLAEAFCQALNSQDKLHRWLDQTGLFDQLKDNEYVAFFLDMPLTIYQQAHQNYLTDKLFNTDAYNQTDESGEVWGTSNFFNGFGNKKPFLMHRSASFDINGRITATMARQLFEFSNLLQRNILPRPLPIFAIHEELLTTSVTLFKKEALVDPTERKTHQEIMLELLQQHEQDLGNYYLLYHSREKILDFDFVSKFRYRLKDQNGNPWKVQLLLRKGKSFQLEQVFEFQNLVIGPLFNNALVVKTKNGGLITKYFEDIDPKYCDNNNALIHGLILKYRKAIYDFIYKSRTQALTPAAVKDLFLTSIRSDILRDEDHEKTYAICQKLNTWFSLNHHFDPTHSNFNGQDMTSTIPTLLEKMRQVANEQAHFESPEEFTFGAGQVIYFLLDKSQTGNKTHALLEPFMQKAKPELLKTEIVRIFDRYKHAINFGKGRFERLMREVLAYSEPIDLRAYLPTLLAGYFADSIIYEKKQSEA